MARPKSDKPKSPKNPKVPKKPRAKKAEQAEAPQKSSPASAVPVSHQFKKPNADQVTRLVKALVSAGNEARSITQTSSEKIARAVENQHFDKKALMIVKGLYQMAKNRPESFAVTLPHLLAYIDDLELVKIADDARGLDLEGQDDEGGDEGTDQGADEQPASGKSPGLSIVPRGENDEQVPSPSSAVA